MLHHKALLKLLSMCQVTQEAKHGARGGWHWQCFSKSRAPFHSRTSFTANFPFSLHLENYLHNFGCFENKWRNRHHYWRVISINLSLWLIVWLNYGLSMEFQLWVRSDGQLSSTHLPLCQNLNHNTLWIPREGNSTCPCSNYLAQRNTHKNPPVTPSNSYISSHIFIHKK